MPQPTRLPFALTVGFLSMAAFAAMVILLNTPYVYSFDRSVMSFVQSFESAFLTEVMLFLSWIGSTPVVIVLVLVTMIVLKAVLRHRAELWVLIVTMAGTGIWNVALKLLFRRERPDLYRLAEASGFSFPSGHAMGAVSFYGILAYLLWRHMPTYAEKAMLLAFGLLMIGGIAVSRIYLGVHYPTDIIGGAAASLAWMSFVVAYFQSRVFRPSATTTH